ncbi:MAG: hypothetical protein AAF402_14205, partial [Pseudomonadota bacterium]
MPTTEYEDGALYLELKDKALSLLVRREHSQHELRQKLLRARSGREDLISRILTDLESDNAQSD